MRCLADEAPLPGERGFQASESSVHRFNEGLYLAGQPLLREARARLGRIDRRGNRGNLAQRAQSVADRGHADQHCCDADGREGSEAGAQ